MKVLWLVLFFVCAKGASISEIAHFDGSPEQEEKPKKPEQTVEKFTEKICGPSGLKSRVRVNLENPFYSKTTEIKTEKIDIRLNLFKKNNYYGKKINVDCAHNVTKDGKFFVKINSDFYGRKEDYKLNIKGRINGKSMNETGKLLLQWDKVGTKFEGDADRNANDFDNVLFVFDCENPTMEIEGLDGIVDHVEKKSLKNAIYNVVLENWKNELKEGKNSTTIRNFGSCKRKNS